jgi:uncharacterized protein (TIGR02246 family)
MTLIVPGSSVHVAGAKEDAYRLLEEWRRAFADADVDGIAKLYAPEATMIGSAKGVMTKAEQIRQYFDVALNKNRPRTATFNSSEASVVDDSTVVIAGMDTITSSKDGQTIAGTGRVTFVVAKRGSDWKIVHLHRSPSPAS